jgi:hypothetical protein
MARLSADKVAVAHHAAQRLCICSPCVYGFRLPLEIDGEEFRFCGELCVVGRPIYIVVGDALEATSKAASFTAPSSSLQCSICSVEIDPLPSQGGATLSLDN